jgi:hypothetical protein
MADAEFHFIAIPSVGECCWHVRQGGDAGLFLGTVVEVGGGWEASRAVAGGQLRTQRFADRDAAAQWLASITPKHGR